MALPDLTGQYIQDTYQRVLQKSGSGDIVDGTGSIFIPPNAVSASYADFAVSASHEIIKEVSSSHADTASFAQSGDGIFSGSFSGSYAGYGGDLTGIAASNWTSSAGKISRVGAVEITGSLLVSGSFASFTIDSDDIVMGDGAGATMRAGGNQAVSYNVLIGKNAGSLIDQYGTQNVAIGREAGTGDANQSVAIGSYAAHRFKYGKKGNIGVGYYALSCGGGTYGNLADGEYNVAVGYEAGRNICDGVKNTAIGPYAGRNWGGYNAGGDGNIGIGHGAGYNQTTGDGNITIGSGSLGVAGESNQLRIGNGMGMTTISASLITGDLIFPSAVNVGGTQRSLFTSCSLAYSGSNVTQVTQSFESGNTQITNILYSGSFADGNPLSIAVTGSDGVSKLYTLTYSASLVTQILVT